MGARDGGSGQVLPAPTHWQHIWADQGYTGTLVRWAEQEYGWTVQVVYPADRQMRRYAPEVLADLGDGDAQTQAPGFHVIKRRWVVERTQPYYLQFALDVQLSSSHDRMHGIAQPA